MEDDWANGNMGTTATNDRMMTVIMETMETMETVESTATMATSSIAMAMVTLSRKNRDEE